MEARKEEPDMDQIKNLGIDQQWYDFLVFSYKRKAAEWCEENGIEYEE